MKPVTVSGFEGALVVTASFEGERIHITREFRGSTQHKFMKAWDGTRDELSTAARADMEYLKDEILKAADARTARHYRSSNPLPRKKKRRGAFPKGRTPPHLKRYLFKKGHR